MNGYHTIDRLARGAATVVLLAFVGLLAFAGQAASAFTGYSSEPNTVFGAPGPGEGRLSGPVGVAVDESSGDVYVADAGNNRVEKFDAEGKYIAQFSGAQTPAGSFSDPREVAVDNSSSPAKGDVYVTDAGHGVIDVFDSSGEYLLQIKGTPSSFAGELVGVAVDASGNVWAYESDGSVDKFSDTGSFSSQFNTGGGTIAGFAVDSSGDVYLLSGCGCVGKYDGTGTQLAEWGAGSALAVNDATGNVFLDVSSGVEEFGPFGEPYGVPVQAFGSGSISSSEGIAVNGKTGTVYVSDGATDTVAIFKVGVYPDTTTGAPSEVKRTGATLEGVVNPDGREVTSCEFEYGTGQAYGQTAACVPADPGSGSSPVTVTAKVIGLTSATAYHYRLVAGNANGLQAGADATFSTPPAVAGVRTDAASEVLGTTATLNGSLEPNGFDTDWWFEYGPTEAYGSGTEHQDAGEASEAKPVSMPLAGLEPNTVYHYRLMADNTFGTTPGADETVATAALAPVLAPPLPVSAITRATATISADVNPEKSLTTWRVLYGETSAYGEHTPEFQAGEALGEETLRFGLEGLVPGRTYHYAVQATNQAGTVTGPDETFTTEPATPPGVVTGGASNIALTTATVAGTIEPVGLETSYVLELGTSAEYGTSIAGEAGASAQPVQIAVPLQYLAPGTTYHYRFVAINSDGRSYGADRTFTTPVYSNPIVLPATLPLIAIPMIAFPTETQGSTAHKTAPGKRRGKRAHKHRRRKHSARAKRRRARHKH